MPPIPTSPIPTPNPVPDSIKYPEITRLTTTTGLGVYYYPETKEISIYESVDCYYDPVRFTSEQLTVLFSELLTYMFEEDAIIAARLAVILAENSRVKE